MSVIVFQCLSLFLMRRGCMPYTLPDSMHCKLVVSCVLMEKTKSHAMFFFLFLHNFFIQALPSPQVITADCAHTDLRVACSSLSLSHIFSFRPAETCVSTRKHIWSCNLVDWLQNFRSFAPMTSTSAWMQMVEQPLKMHEKPLLQTM